MSEIIEKLEDMDGNPNKVAHRGYEIGTVLHYFPASIPKDQVIVTLGGIYTDKYGKLIASSEIAFFLRILGVNPKQIISVDCKRSVIKTNEKNTDPACKGIRNVYSPIRTLTGKGKMGGIESVVYDLVKNGQKIAVVSADLMGTVRKLVPTVVSILHTLRYQKEKALVMFNFNAKDRHPQNNDFCAGYKGTHGNYDVMEAFQHEKTTTGNWTEFQTIKASMRLNFELVSKRGYCYIGGKRTPMTALSLIKPATKTKEKLPVRKTKKELTKIAKKAWKTRRKNAKKVTTKKTRKKVVMSAKRRTEIANKAWKTRRKNARKVA